VDSSLALPSGVVTFLMTDIEGSTGVWEREPDRMREALARHDAVVNTCVKRQHGHVVKSKGEGDSVFAVFEHVRDAVTAALVMQCALAREAWPTSTPLRVRMAIHTGQIDVEDGDYNGPSVNRCARLRGLAAGGEVLLSDITARLSKEQLPAGASLTDLGVHQLKGLSGSERIWQLMHPWMPANLDDLAEPEAPEPSVADVVASRTAFVLTDHVNRSADGREWGRRIRQVAYPLNGKGGVGQIECYASPNLAALLNAQNERFRMPRLWEASVDLDLTPGDAIVACREVTTSHQVPMPTLTGMHHARFAVLCARAAFGASAHEDTEFGHWADGWLNGHDSSGVGARAIAVELEADADRGTAVGQPKEMMAANAARAALHASGLAFRGGRDHAEENTRAIHFATEAVRTALRMTRLDLPTLADEAVNPVVPKRLTTPHAPSRILRTLPT
jgi:class 3 adenylate cyclase